MNTRFHRFQKLEEQDNDATIETTKLYEDRIISAENLSIWIKKEFERMVLKDCGWNVVENVDKNISLEEWKKISHLYPPSFYSVWVKIKGKGKKIKAYYDAPNKIWMRDKRNVWDDDEIKDVIAWREILSRSIAKQKLEK